MRKPGGRAAFRAFPVFPQVVAVSERGFEPRRAIRPLGPQPSASAKFRHSDPRASAILPEPRQAPTERAPRIPELRP